MRGKILQILVILFLLALAANTGRQLLKLNQAKTKFDKAAAKLENLKVENQNLRSELQLRQTPEYIEKEAREKLGLVKEGETLVILPKVEKLSEVKSQNGSNLKFWLRRLFGKS